MTVDLDPIIFSLGPIEVRWYGLMYVIDFIVAGLLAKILIKRGFFKIPVEKLDGCVTAMLIGMFLGARLFYVFVYNWDYYSQNLLELFSVWQGGLSFHGAILGMMTAGYIFAKRNGITWFQMMDVTVLAGTPGLFFGRIGNFINGELYGRITDVPWGMVFPAGGPYPRHPSQLYESFFEGIVLSLILWGLVGRVKHYGILSCVFTIGYGTFRYFIEFFREADAQLGLYWGGTTTMGQILCLLMVVGGLLLTIPVRRFSQRV